MQPKEQTPQPVNPKFPKKPGSYDEKELSKESKDNSSEQDSTDVQNERDPSSGQARGTSVEQNTDKNFAGTKNKDIDSERSPNTGSRDEQKSLKDWPNQKGSSSTQSTDEKVAGKKDINANKVKQKF